jgi:hypothetical protein
MAGVFEMSHLILIQPLIKLSKNRIIQPVGKVPFLQLYTHHCTYSTNEYYGKGYPDSGAKEYIRLDWCAVPAEILREAT